MSDDPKSKGPIPDLRWDPSPDLLRIGLVRVFAAGNPEPDLPGRPDDPTPEDWVRELIFHIENFRQILESRHVQLVEKLLAIRDLVIQIEVLTSRRIDNVGIIRNPPTDPARLLERAETLLGECERIDSGEVDSFGPGVTWERLDWLMGLARSASPAFRQRTDDWLPYVESSRRVAESDPWWSGDPRAVRAVFARVSESLRAARIDVARGRWERWSETKDRTQQVILKEVRRILETAEGPLTRKQIEGKFRPPPEWSLLGKALSAARKDGLLANRSKQPRGYFFPERFPDLISL
jgi:hypothetical protein